MNNLEKKFSSYSQNRFEEIQQILGGYIRGNKILKSSLENADNFNKKLFIEVTKPFFELGEFKYYFAVEKIDNKFTTIFANSSNKNKKDHLDINNHPVLLNKLSKYHHQNIQTQSGLDFSGLDKNTDIAFIIKLEKINSEIFVIGVIDLANMLLNQLNWSNLKDELQISIF